MSESGRPVRELCFILVTGDDATGRQVLLGRKRRGFGFGRFVVPGGKVDAGETPREAAARELAEETSLVVAATSLTELGNIRYTFAAEDDTDLLAHVFAVHAPAGEARDSHEIAVTWRSAEQLPFDEMWADARVWMPLALAGKGVAGLRFAYAADGVTLIERSDR